MARRRGTPGRGPVRPNKPDQNAIMRQRAKRAGYQKQPGQKLKSWTKERSWSRPVQMGGIPIPEAPNYNVQKAAQNQVRLADEPNLQEIAAQQRAAYDMWKEQDRGSRSIARGAQEMFSTPGDIRKQLGGVANTMNRAMGGVNAQQDAFDGGAGQDAPALAGEEAAQNSVMSGIGGNAAAALQGQAQSAVVNQRGMQDQFAVDLATRRANYLEDFQDQIQALRENRLDVLKDNPMQILAQRNTLADQRFGQESARFGMGADYEQAMQDKNFSKALQELIAKEMERKNRGGGSPSRRRNPNQSRNNGDHNHDGKQDETLTQPGGGWGWESGGRDSGGSGGGGGIGQRIANWDAKGDRYHELLREYLKNNDYDEDTKFKRHDGTWLYNQGTGWEQFSGRGDDQAEHLLQRRRHARRKTKKLQRKSRRRSGADDSRNWR